MQIYQPKEGYCYNSDTLFLYDFALKSLKPKKQVLEVGSGSGVLGLLCAREVEMNLAMIEKNPKMLELCQHNLRVNKIRANLIGGDFLEYDFNIESNKSYKNLDKLDFVKNISKFTSSIWQIHPFREGNTRTIAVFIIKYLNSKGLSVNNEPFKDNSKYFRDALVLSNYADYTNNIVEDNEYLISFFNLAIFNNSKLKVMNKI